VSYWTDSTSTDFPYYEVVIYPMASYGDPVEEMKRYWCRAFKRLGRHLQKKEIMLSMLSEHEQKRLNVMRWTTRVVDNIWRTIKAFWRWKLRS
jgi:hypothetical protein